jgi:hypothetical protein
VLGVGVEPTKARGRLIYSQMRLTTSLTQQIVKCNEPPVGFEPTTCCLQNSCSAAELRWQNKRYDTPKIISQYEDNFKPFPRLEASLVIDDIFL